MDARTKYNADNCDSLLLPATWTACATMVKTYDIKRGVSWGSASTEQQKEWDHLDCDYDLYTAAPTLRVDGCASSPSTLYDYRIAFLTPITTRKLGASGKVSDMPLWTFLIPSFLATSSSTQRHVGFDFVFGYDPDDVLLSVESNREEFKRIWTEKLGAANVQSGKYRMAMLVLDYGFTRSAVSWAVGALAAYAVSSGADFMFQVNDDLTLITPGWVDVFPDVLAQHGFVGVTGPDDQTNPSILTQSFVHKTHLDIFKRYFPRQTRNWYSDDWITGVYGQFTVRSHGISARHVVVTGSARYDVHMPEGLVKPALDIGKQKLNSALTTKLVTVTAVSAISRKACMPLSAETVKPLDTSG